MDLVGLLLIGAVLLFGSIYAAWSTWAVWKEARILSQGAKVHAATAPLATSIQHVVTALFALIFLLVAATLCLSIAQGDSCVRGLEQLKSLIAGETVAGGVSWGEGKNQGTLHVSSRASVAGRVTGASLAYIEFDNADLDELLEQYPHLEWFILSGTQVNDLGMGLLARRRNTDAIVLTDTSVTDAGLVLLRGHLRLRELDLTRTSITDRSLETVKSMRGIEHLVLRDTAVTDNGVKFLQGNTHLRTLSIQETKVTDAAIPYLASLRNLRFLNVRDSALSSAGIARLHRALPECEIIPGLAECSETHVLAGRID